MRRKAIIIGSPLIKTAPNYLEGVIQDVNNYIEFLCSLTGGAWHKNEIETLINPSGNSVLRAIANLAGFDFAFVVFSGHGARNGEDYIQINSRETIPLKTLIGLAKRQLIISDSCRSEHSLSYFEGLGGLNLEYEQGNNHVSRSLYDYFISNLSDGVMILSSCSPGENSKDGKNGGLFSTSLLEAVHSWSLTENQVQLTFENVFKITYSKLSPRQKPTAIVTSDALRHFPLALNPTAYLMAMEVNGPSKVPATVGGGNISGVFGFLAFGLLAGCLIAAIVE